MCLNEDPLNQLGNNLPANYPISNPCVQILHCECIVRHPRPAEPSLELCSLLVSWTIVQGNSPGGMSPVF